MHDTLDKPVVWLGSSLKNVRAFPPDARRLAGYQLRRVQTGLVPSDYKLVKAVGPACTKYEFTRGSSIASSM